MSSDVDVNDAVAGPRSRALGWLEPELVRFGSTVGALLVGVAVRSGRSELVVSTKGGTQPLSVERLRRVLHDAACSTSAGFEVMSLPLTDLEDRRLRLLVWFDSGAALAVAVDSDSEHVSEPGPHDVAAFSLLSKVRASETDADDAVAMGSRSLARVDADGLVVGWPARVPAGGRVFELVEHTDRETVAEAMWSVLNGSSAVVRVSCRLVGERTVRHWYLASDGAGGIEGVFVEPVRPTAMLPSEVARWLTQRERQVAGLIASGYRPGEAAVELGVSTNTLRNHLKCVYSKLGVHGQRELMSLIDRHTTTD